MTQKEIQDPWLKRDPDAYNLFKYMQFLNEIFPYKTKHWDLRYFTTPDSYVIRVNR